MTTDVETVKALLNEHYPSGWALRLIQLYGPNASVASPGKQPMERDWARQADARASQRNGQVPDRHAWLSTVIRNWSAGGNIGLAIPDGVVVLDADDQAAVEHITACSPPSTPRQRTARGTHFVYRLPDGAHVVNSTRHALPNGGVTDVRTHGAQIVVEPSMHSSGSIYSWQVPLPGQVSDLPLIPQQLMDVILVKNATRPEAHEQHAQREAAGWEPPPFPVHVLPAWLAEIVEMGAARTEAPIELAAVPALASLAAALGPGWKAQVQSLIEAPRLWFAACAPPASGKSPTAEPFIAPLDELDRELKEQHQQALQAFKDEFESDGDKKPKKPVRARACITDCTPEGAAKALAGSPRGILLHSDELAQHLSSLDGYQARPGKGRSFWLSVWSGSRHSECRKVAEETEVEDPYAVIFGGLTGAALSSLELRNNDGLAARYQWCLPKCPPHGLGIQTDVAERWRHAVRAARELAEEYHSPHPVCAAGCALIDEKLREWTAKAKELDEAGAGLLAGMYGKAGTHVVRKIALLHGAEIVGKKISPVTATVEGVAVSIETVKKSIELVEYFLVHGAEAARLMVCPPEDGFEVARGDDEILHLLRSDLRGDEEREATPSEWADRLNRSAGDGTALSPEQVGHAFTRLRETRGSCFVFEKSRGRVRSWKVRRVRPAAGEGRP